MESVSAPRSTCRLPVSRGRSLSRGQPMGVTLVSMVPDRQPNQTRVRLAEVVASLCLATDLATGQPLEHGLRRTLLAVWLGQELGLDENDLSTTYYVALLGSVGCI